MDHYLLNSSKKLIVKYIQLLRSKDYKTFYKEINNDVSYSRIVSNITEILYGSGEDPLKYMSEIPDNFFAYSDIKSFDIPNHIKSIGHNAFEECEIEKINFSQRLKNIGFNTFFACNNLEDISLPASLEKIGGGAFHYCQNLKSIKFSNNYQIVERNAFEGCDNLKDIYFPGTFQELQNCLQEAGISYNRGLTIHCIDGEYKLINFDWHKV